MGRNDDPDRRTVLKRLGAAAATGAAVGAGATGAAAAETSAAAESMEPRSVAATARAMPGEEIATDRVIEAQAGSVLELLAEDGVIETSSVDALTTETVSPYTDSDVAGVSAYEFGDGETRRMLTVDTHVEGGVVEMSVEPGRDAVLAEFHRNDGTTVAYGDFGDGAQKASLSADDTPCCKCCVCYPLGCSDGSTEIRVCYGPEDFGCPNATDGCC